MEQLAAWDAGSALGDNTRDRVNTSSAVAVITVPGDSRSDYLRGGAAVERLWIRAEQFQLGVQPVSPVFLYARSESDLVGLSAEFSDQLRELQHRFHRAVGLDRAQVPVLVLRLSHNTSPPAVRSQRMNLDAVVSSRHGSPIERDQSW